MDVFEWRRNTYYRERWLLWLPYHLICILSALLVVLAFAGLVLGLILFGGVAAIWAGWVYGRERSYPSLYSIRENGVVLGYGPHASRSRVERPWSSVSSVRGRTDRPGWFLLVLRSEPVKARTRGDPVYLQISEEEWKPLAPRLPAPTPWPRRVGRFG